MKDRYAHARSAVSWPMTPMCARTWEMPVSRDLSPLLTSSRLISFSISEYGVLIPAKRFGTLEVDD